MMGWLYRIMLWLGLPLVWLRLQRRARREPAYGERQSERFGRVPGNIPVGPIWFHTVSAGETIAAAPLIRQLAEEFAPAPFLVTTMTPTGSEQVTTRLADCVAHCYAPYDFMFAVRQFYESVQPRLLVLMETELWPNLIGEAHRLGIPVMLVNARLSARSAQGYSRVPGLTQPMLARLDAIACQSQDHVSRFVALGADPQTTTAMGSVKYDVTLPPGHVNTAQRLRQQWGFADHPVWIAASTHPGEDELVLQAFQSIRQEVPDARLILVPRHPVRCDDVAALIAHAGFNSARQSTLESSAAASAAADADSAVDVVLGDVMGTLLTLYGVADVAFVGGSLVELGGHNPLEPAVCEMPIFSGPHQFNFTDVMQALEDAGGLRTVHTAEQLAQGVLGYFADEAARRRDGLAAAANLVQNAGATQRIASLLRARMTSVLS